VSVARLACEPINIHSVRAVKSHTHYCGCAQFRMLYTLTLWLYAYRVANSNELNGVAKIRSSHRTRHFPWDGTLA
jgi:hypothetical protein